MGMSGTYFAHFMREVVKIYRKRWLLCGWGGEKGLRESWLWTTANWQAFFVVLLAVREDCFQWILWKSLLSCLQEWM